MLIDELPGQSPRMEMPCGDAGCDGVEPSLPLRPSGSSTFVSLQHLGAGGGQRALYSWGFMVGCRERKLMGSGVGKLL